MSNKAVRFFQLVNEQGLRNALSSTYNYLGKIPSRTYERIYLYMKYIQYERNWIVTKEINGSLMKLNFNPNEPHHIERRLFKQNIREPEFTKLFTDALDKLNAQHDDIYVFDIGANIGYFALMEAEVLDNASIYAIEAEPRNVERLRTNIKLNDYSIEVIPHAAGGEQKTKQLAVRSLSNIHRMSEVLDQREYQDIVNVDVYPLDQLIAQRDIPVNGTIVVRMDVEGYEHHVLKGMEGVLSSNRSFLLFIELHPSTVNTDNIVDDLEDSRFSPEYLITDEKDVPKKLSSFAPVREVESNCHVMASRM